MDGTCICCYAEGSLPQFDVLSEVCREARLKVVALCALRVDQAGEATAGLRPLHKLRQGHVDEDAGSSSLALEECVIPKQPSIGVGEFEAAGNSHFAPALSSLSVGIHG